MNAMANDKHDSPATLLQGFEATESFIRAFLLCDNHQTTMLNCDIKVDGACLKRYRLQDFQDAWERYAGPLVTPRNRENSVTRA